MNLKLESLSHLEFLLADVRPNLDCAFGLNLIYTLFVFVFFPPAVFVAKQ